MIIVAGFQIYLIKNCVFSFLVFGSKGRRKFHDSPFGHAFRPNFPIYKNCKLEKLAVRCSIYIKLIVCTVG